MSERPGSGTPSIGVRGDEPSAANARLILGAIIALGAVLRLWGLGTIGFNSDEAVYAGQAAALAGNPIYGGLFQVFRAHPLLIQFLVSLVFRVAIDDTLARLVGVAFGLAALPLVYATGAFLYDRRVGLIAATILALMPYHVVVSRQILLDAPMTTLFMLGVYGIARYTGGGQARWLYAAAIAGGLAVLAKETAVLLAVTGGAMLLVIPEMRIHLGRLAAAAVLFLVAVSPYPAAVAISGATDTARQFLVWQVLRSPNHSPAFYAEILPGAMGILVLALAVVGLVQMIRRRGWQDRLILIWIIVPVAFFEAWPVKGYQYLLPIAPAVAITASVGLARWLEPRLWRWLSAAAPIAVNVVAGAVALSLLLPSAQGVLTLTTRGSLAGTGGLPGGREAGLWIREHVPAGATFMTIGPTMSNIVRFYGQRPSYGLSVSPNPLRRNPAYDPIRNPDRSIQLLRIQYIAFDVWSAERSPFFANALRRYIDRYNGRLVHEQLAVTRDSGDHISEQVVIEIYEVRP